MSREAFETPQSERVVAKYIFMQMKISQYMRKQ